MDDIEVKVEGNRVVITLRLSVKAALHLISEMLSASMRIRRAEVGLFDWYLRK